MADFTHLHVHSHYSLLDGLGTVPNLVKHAGSLGFDALALTDHGVLYGAVEFSKKAKSVGIKPIIGCELYVAPRTLHDKVNRIDTSPHHLIVLCQNKIGYQNLLKLVSIAHLEGYYYKPRVDKQILKDHSEGLICLTACLQGEVSRAAGDDDPEGAAKALKDYVDIFTADRLFLELQHHPELPKQVMSNKHLVDLSKRFNLPLVATNDVHYLKYEDAEAQDALLCIQTGRFMSEKDRMTMKENGHFIDISMLSATEMKERFAETPDAIDNTKVITDRCQFEMELGRYIFPAFPVPKDKTPHQYLSDLCIEGLSKRVLKIDPPTNNSPDIPDGISLEYKERLEYEMGIIEKTGFSSYMLMVADYTNEAKRRGIFTNTRGSAAGSLVAYLIGITDVDPMPYQLIFERFLNPERISWPDVDLDIADVRRGELIEYVAQKYGPEKVAQIITFGTIAAKNSIRDVGRVLGMPYSDVDIISKLVPMGMTLVESLDSVPALKSRYESEPEVGRLIDLAKKIEGVARHASVHAAGVVIADKDLTEYVPIQRVKEETGTVTQYSMYDLEAVGLVKMDFLGLANLSIIERALEIIKATRKIEIIPADLPLDDTETFKLLSRGESSGVFQLESDGMKRYLKELKPSEIGDIIAMVALYRPGPMELIPDYISGKHKTKTITYLHPKLKPILEDTYGIAVYQEQILQIARELCGFSYGEADVLRKAIGKKNKELLLEQREKWVKKGVECSLDKKLAEKLFDFVEPFARYGFNKAHATSYGIIAYQTAYLKSHFPSQFMAAWLTSEQSRDIEKVAFALQECERMGIKVLPPDVNESYADFGVVANNENKDEPIRFGLGAIKNVGHGVAEMIVKERKQNGPFESLEDFIKRVDAKIINRKTMESLIQAGGFDRFADRNSMLMGIETILKYANGLHANTNGQMGLFGESTGTADVNALILPKAAATTKDQRLLWEKELLGIYLSDHPLSNLKDLIGKATTSISNLSSDNVGKTVRVLGIVTNAKQIITKSKQPMVFAKIEDTTASTEVIVFPSVLETTASFWQNDRLVLVDGKVNDKDGSIKILADEAWDITGKSNLDDLELPPLSQSNGFKANGQPSHSKRSQTANPNHTKSSPTSIIPMLNIDLPSGCDKETLREIKTLIGSFPGQSKLVIQILHNGSPEVINVTQRIEASPVLLHQLKNLVGNANIKLINDGEL